MLRHYKEKRNPRCHYASWRYLAARQAVAGGILERANAFRKRSGSTIHRLRFFNLGDERGADYGRVGQAPENGNVAGKRDAEANGDGELRDAAGAADERWEIVGQGILRAGNAGAGNQIEKAGRTGGDFREAFVCGSGSAKKNGVEMVHAENAAIVFGFFGCEIGSENSVRAGRRCGRCESFEAHLQDGIVVAKENKRDLGKLTNAADKIENTGESRPGSQSALRSALDRRPIRERIAEGHAQFINVRAGFSKCTDEFQRGVEGRIADGDVSDDAEFAGCAEFGEAFGDAGRVKRSRGHWISGKDKD